MSLLFSTVSLVIGLYFWRNNIILSIVISIIYLGFLLYRFGIKKFPHFLIFFVLGVTVPKIPIFPHKQNFPGIVIEAKDDYIIYESGLHKYYVKSEDNDFEVGDILNITGYTVEFKTTTFESRFDFQEYLYNKGVNEELKTNIIDTKFHTFIQTHKFKKYFLSKFDENTATLISAFLFNDKDYSSDPIRHADSSGIVYLFSLSGVYLNILFEAISYLLFIKLSRKKSRLLTFLILLPYAFFSFSKIGTLRVYSLYLLKYMNEFHFKKRKFSHVELVSLLALIFLIIDYHLVYQEAFYIGFLLSVLTPFLHNSIKFLSKKKQKIAMPIIVRLFVLPIQVRGGYFDILSFLKYSLILPITFIFLLISMLAVVIPYFGFVNLAGKGVSWVLEKMDLVNTKIPFGNWGGAFPIVYYAVFIVCIYLLESVRVGHLKKCLAFISIFILMSVIPLQEPISNAVYFINVGQGDSILLKNRNHTVMIDTGGNTSFDMATESLIPFMNKKKITHLDALITTHDDFDHSGAKDSLIANFTVDSYLNKASDFPYKIGDIYLENLNNKIYEEDNDNSLVLSLNFIGKKWLFMGDASTKVEKELISNYKDLSCDILKIGHHGSNTSSSEEFIKTVKPKEAIISVGSKNYYGHPNKEILDRLNKYAVKIRRTDEEGTISYFSLIA